MNQLFLWEFLEEKVGIRFQLWKKEKKSFFLQLLVVKLSLKKE